MKNIENGLVCAGFTFIRDWPIAPYELRSRPWSRREKKKKSELKLTVVPLTWANVLANELVLSFYRVKQSKKREKKKLKQRADMVQRLFFNTIVEIDIRFCNSIVSYCFLASSSRQYEQESYAMITGMAASFYFMLVSWYLTSIMILSIYTYSRIPSNGSRRSRYGSSIAHYYTRLRGKNTNTHIHSYFVQYNKS